MALRKACSIDIGVDDEDSVFKSNPVVLRQRNRGEKLTSNYKLRKPQSKQQDPDSLGTEKRALPKKTSDTSAVTDSCVAISNETCSKQIESVVQTAIDSIASDGSTTVTDQRTNTCNNKKEKVNFGVFSYTKSARLVASVRDNDNQVPSTNETYACDVCKINISHLSEDARLEHVNHCLDQRQNDSDENLAITLQAVEHAPLPNLGPANSPAVTTQCFICKKVIGQKNSVTHLKKCATKFNISTADLLKMREESLVANANNSLQPVSLQTVKASGRQRKRLPRVPRTKLDEDMQLALALSASTYQQHKQASDAFERLTLPQKHHVAAVVTALTSTSDDERARILQARVAALLQTEAELADRSSGMSGLSSTIPAKYSSKQDNVAKSSLWQLSGVRCVDPQQTFYVAALSPPVVVDTVVVGSKVCVPIRQQAALAASAKIAAALVPLDSQSDSDDSDSAPSSQTALILAQLAAANQTQPSQHRVTSLSQSEYFAAKNKPVTFESSGFLPSDQLAEETVACEQQNSVTVSALVNTLQQSLLTMVDNRHGSDILLRVAHGDIVHAHTFVLDLRCPLLLKDTTLLEHNSKSAVLSTMKYLYGAIVPVDPALCKEVYTIACRLKLNELAAQCEQRLCLTDSDAADRISITLERDIKSSDSRNSSSSFKQRPDVDLQKILADVWGADTDSDSESDEDGDAEEDEGEAELDAELYEYMATQRQRCAATDDKAVTGACEFVNCAAGDDVNRESALCAEVAEDALNRDQAVVFTGSSSPLPISDTDVDVCAPSCVDQAGTGLDTHSKLDAVANKDDDDSIIDLELGPSDNISCIESKQLTSPRSRSRGRCSVSPDLFSPVTIASKEANTRSSQRKRSYPGNSSSSDTPATSTTVKKRRSGLSSKPEPPSPEYVDLTQCANDLDFNCDDFGKTQDVLLQRNLDLEKRNVNHSVNWDDEDDLPDIPPSEPVPPASTSKMPSINNSPVFSQLSAVVLLSSSVTPVKVQSPTAVRQCSAASQLAPIMIDNTNALPEVAIVVSPISPSNASSNCDNNCITTCTPPTTSRQARCPRRRSSIDSASANDGADVCDIANISYPDIPAWDDVNYSPFTLPHSTPEGRLTSDWPAAASNQANATFDLPSDCAGDNVSSDNKASGAANVSEDGSDDVVSVTSAADVTDSSNVTVYPHYSLMETPRVQAACQKVGVKTKLPKKKMVTVLKHIYCEQHGRPEACPAAAKPVEKEKQARKKKSAESAAAGAKSSRPVTQSKKRATSSAAVTKQPIAVAESAAEDDDLPQYTGKRVVMEESTLECYEPDDDEDVGDTQTAAVAASNNSDATCTMVCDYIRSHPELYLKVLHYETIEFEWIRNELAHAGHHISVAQLTEVLDSQGILFSFRQSDKARFIPTGNKKRRRAKNV